MAASFVTGTRKLTVDAKRPGAVSLLLIGSLLVTVANADTWVEVTGNDRLREFVSGARVEIDLTPGVTASGEYFADGTAKVEAWGETFPRTWEVSGDDQVCYTSETETSCFSYEQNLDTPGEYRASNVETGEVITFRVSGTEPRIMTRSGVPDDEGGPGSPSASDIAKELSDPNTSLGTMNLNFDYVKYQGDLPRSSSQRARRITFQPSLPYKLTETTNLFVRPAIPLIVDQDVPGSNGEFDSKGTDLGDISFDAALATTLSNGVVLVGGLVGTMPTATDDDLGLEQWLLGPEAAIAVVRKWGVAGVLVTHQWDVAGEDDYSTSITGGQYFYTFNLDDGWQINGSPTFSYNHEADSDDALAFPLAAGLAKTVILDGRPWKFSLQYWHYVQSPDVFGPDNQIRFTVSPVVKLPW